MEATAERQGRVFYSVKEAAEKLECSDKSIYRYIKQRVFRASKKIGGIKLSRAEVDMYHRLMLEGKI
jgi:excisionase family DNA binding protein